MTKKEMTEIFSVMMLAWPNAELFKGGIQKLGPTIELWSTCTADVDFRTGQQAVIRLCKSCKFPPSVAEFVAQIEVLREEVKSQCCFLMQELRCAEHLYGSFDDYYRYLRPESFQKQVIDRVGGFEKLVVSNVSNGEVFKTWNLNEIEAACVAVIHSQEAMIHGQRKSLIAGK